MHIIHQFSLKIRCPLFQSALRGNICVECSRNFNKLVKTDEWKIYKPTARTGFVDKLSDWCLNKVRGVIPSVINMDLSPPTCVRGMKVLDRDSFKRKVFIPTIKAPNVAIPHLSKQFKKSMLKMIGIKPICCLDDKNPDKDTNKLIMLDPCSYTSTQDFDEAMRNFLAKNDVDLESFKLHQIELTYLNWGHVDILKAVLPKESDGVAGFSSIGHIVHLNLRDNILEYKQIIGEVLLDKIPTARTVVHKLNTIDNTYRNFEMEVLAGDKDFVVKTKEHKNSFEFDFSKVYWNPRLSTEHQRLADLLKPGDILYDVFAGVGPFAVPAAKKKCKVLANDLNPESFKWLKHNMKLNKVKAEYSTHNLDGRMFIQSIVKDDLLKRWKTSEPEAHPNYHIVMNLPALAIEFLDAFSGLLKYHGDLDCSVIHSLPRVHCHCFSKADDPAQDVQERAAKNLGHDLQNASVWHVRNVAPNKDMMCISFDLTWDILLQDEGEPAEKKMKKE